MEVNCIALPSRKKAYLLHFAGPEVQDIFYDIPGHDAVPPANSDVYREAIRLLDNHFAPMTSIPYDRYVFRNLKQENDESVDKFVSRLKERGRLCEYGAALDIRITEQVFDRCQMDELREMILKKKLMTVREIVEEARILETVKRNREQMAKGIISTEAENINLVTNSKKKDACFRCGQKGHFANDKGCPARGKECGKCKLVGHFKKMCRTKATKTSSSKRKQVLYVESEKSGCSSNSDDCDSEDDGSNNEIQQICVIGADHDIVTCYTGGVKMNWIIDSGAYVNVINRNTWKELRKKGCKTSSEKKSKNILRVYGDGSLKVHKVIKADIATKEKTVHHEIYVVDSDRGGNLLSKKSSMELGILEIHGKVFNISAKEEPPIGKLKGVQVELKINTAVNPVQQPCRRLPIPLQKLVEAKLEDLLRQDIIEPAPLNISWASPLVVTPKNGGRSVRLCVDMRRANNAIIPERHPLPTFDEIMPYLEGSRFFSKIDLVKAFHQIELTPSSRTITTFVTPNAYYRYKRLMFGMNCSAEVFQREIERVLRGLKGTKVFIDDILVFARTKKDHAARVKSVLSRLELHGLTVNLEKCQIGKPSVIFMGHSLSEKGILPMNDKVDAIQRFRNPRNVKELRSFMGLVNYVGKFIPNLSTISSPLRNMLHKHTKFQWTSAEMQSFEKIKRAMSNTQHLAYYSVHNPTTLVTDASEHGLGAVLLQRVEGKLRPISFASKSLTTTERKYSTLDKEALSVVWATERFQMYLKGLEFTILTDHKPLVGIFNETSIPNKRQESWVLRMQEYRYRIRHVPGEINIADPLSRLSVSLGEKTFDKASEDVLCAIVEINRPAAVSMTEIILASEEDHEIQDVRKALQTDIWEENLKKYASFKSELVFAKEILLRKDRIVVPKKLRETVIALSHVGHPGREKMKRRLRAAVWWPAMDGDAEKCCKECIECQLVAPYDKPEPLRIRELPKAPWVHLSGDFLGPLPNGYYLFVLIDLYSRYTVVEPTTRTTSSEVIRILKNVFTRLGLPFMLTFDNAKNFSSQELKEYCVDYDIKLKHTTPYWPSANGEVERQNRSILKVLKISKQNGTDWKEAIQDYIYMYSLTPHSVTNVAPAQLMFGRRFRDLIPNFYNYVSEDDEMRDRDRTVKYYTKENRDKRVGAKQSTVSIGDEVWMKNMVPQNKLDTTFLPTPARVIDRCENSLTLKTPDGEVYRRNTSHVKATRESLNQKKANASINENVGNGSTRPPRLKTLPKRFEDYTMEV
ncbi:uncharacterized protein K02A2.6-like [Malaya genurostris]|uniref:uncharacterized protein K02A2.6-like n=1 Tax=Malaya genurostris TaxID=325434 RepID=UPI0026F3AA53|nr:uncharacterized protein K02A2.6-like [Malaya genurostris]